VGLIEGLERRTEAVCKRRDRLPDEDIAVGERRPYLCTECHVTGGGALKIPADGGELALAFDDVPVTVDERSVRLWVDVVGVRFVEALGVLSHRDGWPFVALDRRTRRRLEFSVERRRSCGRRVGGGRERSTVPNRGQPWTSFA